MWSWDIRILEKKSFEICAFDKQVKLRVSSSRNYLIVIIWDIKYLYEFIYYLFLIKIMGWWELNSKPLSLCRRDLPLGYSERGVEFICLALFKGLIIVYDLNFSIF